jgi:hypothetical protein
MLVLWFGRHKGRTLAEVPTGYLSWALANVAMLTDRYQQAIRDILAKREQEQDPRQIGVNPKDGAPTRTPEQGVNPKDVGAALAEVFDEFDR